jgi:ATP-dependent RNA circularization protein (DNA/RNA ligase family)
VVEGFVKFPRTPHLFWQGESAPRGDKLLDPAEATALLRRPVSVEEKVDGANVGLSVGPDGRLRAQSRGAYLEQGTAGQWKPLWRWLAFRESRISRALNSSLILFGEWCYAEHSIPYDALPDWLLVIDVYDRSADRFWSRARRDVLAHRLGLSVVPLLGEGRYNTQSLRKLIGPSRLGSVQAEGIYLRWDEGQCLTARAKVVRPGWVLASEEHWASRPLKINRVVPETATESKSSR